MKKKKKNRDYLYLLLPLLTAMFVALGFYIQHVKEEEALKRAEDAANRAARATTELTTEATREATTEASTEEKVQDVIDFGPLKKQNEDIYAWIRVPGTEVDYPVLQHPSDNEFYLHHNVDKQESIYGSIYTELVNEKDFLDPNTVIYGHNMNNGSMFGSLHRFEDGKFFKKHRKIWIYTEDEIHEYKIFAAFVHSNEHLFYGYDFDDPDDYDRFLTDVYAHTEEGAHIDRNMEVTSEDRIITLSTCNHGIAEQRYLIVAVEIQE